MIRISESELRRAILGDNNTGICRDCGFETDGVEPDARNYKCAHCGMCEVFGVEELLMMDELEVTNES